MSYIATHTSVEDGSTAMLVRYGKAGWGVGTITLVNEDGYEWTDPADQWEPL